jgi:bilirubin oxidase
MFHCQNLVHEDNDTLVAFNVTNLAKWGYTNDTLFIDPMQPEFRPKPYNAADYTEDAIMKKIAWFYSTNAYNHGNVAGVYSAIENGGEQARSTSASATKSNNTSSMSTMKGWISTMATSAPVRSGTAAVQHSQHSTKSW